MRHAVLFGSAAVIALALNGPAAHAHEEPGTPYLSLAQAQQGQAQQQQGGITRTVLQRVEFPGERHVTIVALVDIAPGAVVARHTHPGIEIGYVMEGEGEWLVQGQPARRIRAGDTTHVPAGEVPHSIRNGDRLMRFVSTFVVEKDKPLASPAPE
jgi:quercetin dioxygenase-like cupin family protein